MAGTHYVCLADAAQLAPPLSSRRILDVTSDSQRTIDWMGMGVIAVVVIDDCDDAIPLARALHGGGVRAVELTLRTPSAMESLGRMASALPEMAVGAGTVLTVRQVEEVVRAGAAFGVSPGINPKTVAEARRLGFPFAPGVCTPTDIEMAIESGCRWMKYFPAEPCGGLEYLRVIAAPFAHLGVQFIPLGGVDATLAEMYLRDPLVAAIGGSWIAPRDAIRRRQWGDITARAAAAVEIVRRVRGGGQ